MASEKNNFHLLENELELKSRTKISELFHKIVRVFDHRLFLEDLSGIALNFKKCSKPTIQQIVIPKTQNIFFK
jgi:hypothetical protein